MLSAQLVVTSTGLRLEEITEGLTKRPDSGLEKGELVPISGRPAEETSWILNLEWPEELHPGTMGVGFALDALGETFAESAATLVERGCAVSVVIIQELSDDPWDKGLMFQRDTIKWLALAGAQIVVDQYVFD